MKASTWSRRAVDSSKRMIHYYCGVIGTILDASRSTSKCSCPNNLRQSSRTQGARDEPRRAPTSVGDGWTRRSSALHGYPDGFATECSSRSLCGSLTIKATPFLPGLVAVLLKPFHRTVHLLFFFPFGSFHFPFLPGFPEETNAARVECSKTSRTPSFVRAEHSRYL